MEREKKKIPCPARMAIEGLEKAFSHWGIEHAQKQSCWQYKAARLMFIVSVLPTLDTQETVLACSGFF
ncbi:hypothetical protein [Candidatus Magnetomonas plexicatena]|uniref:hypothetical protein n=1 Tax=Candidatus Magnetomonas plexicatena TaxID=2552947 RepID=UPI001C74012A|nr:hypothetical protein E2O03_007605 [Nitrospirales bacterium LBB_01]